MSRRVRQLDLSAVEKVSDLVEAMGETSYQSRNLARCLNVYEAMLRDDRRVTAFLGIAGAMVPAGMRKVIVDLMKKGLVDVVVSTGANLYHDLAEASGIHHFLGSPDLDDSRLRELSIDRIYDTLADEEGFRRLDEKIAELTSSMEPLVCSSRRYLHELGLSFQDENSIMATAARLNVPIFCPSIADSSIGIALSKYELEHASERGLVINTIKDNLEMAQIMARSPRTGAFLIGGGVPKNFVQQTSVVVRFLGLQQEEPGHSYALQITTDDPKWGGLSGATIEEAISWGKYSPKATRAVAYVDATIGLPILAKSIFERCADIFAKRGRLSCTWNDSVLV
ncbi:MAG: deoxyhypusine synthase family protein, partial [Candidatus Bathyarchaeia archaeon]